MPLSIIGALRRRLPSAVALGHLVLPSVDADVRNEIADDSNEMNPVTQHVSGALTFETRGPGFTDITREINDWVQAQEASDGLLNVFITHTSASLTIQENADPDVRRDLSDALDRMAPRDHAYRHSSEGPDDMPSHIMSMVTSTALSIPVERARMALGIWQGVYLIEHRDAPHERRLMLTFIGTAVTR